MLGDHSECDPPDPISNSEVKPFSADGSVGPPHVRVGHRQALIQNPVASFSDRVFLWGRPILFYVWGAHHKCERPLSAIHALRGTSASMRVVGHRQALIQNPVASFSDKVFFISILN